jgi:hypothetical protein
VIPHHLFSIRDPDQGIDLYIIVLRDHTLTVYAMDKAYNQSTASVTFAVDVT